MQTSDYYKSGFETERLKTRPVRLEDAADWAPFFDDQEAMRFLPPDANPSLSNQAKAQSWMELIQKRYQEKQFGLHALLEKSSGNLIGLGGLIAREIEGKPEIEIVYHMLPSYRGKGYATEAAKVFRDYGFGEGGALSLISLIARDNRKSQRVAEKNGMHATRHMHWSGLDIILYRIDK